jgi:hypothetical protein
MLSVPLSAPQKDAIPFTSSLVAGEVEPIPTLPALVTANALLFPPVATLIA